MARMIDPSGLEGEEPFNWYGRSPADVEAEREAARQAQYDAFVQSIRAASASSQAPTDEFNDESGPSAGQEPPDDGAHVFKAYYRSAGPPVAPPPVMPPSGPMVGPRMDARGGPALGGPRSGFFGTQNYQLALGGYLSDLLWPLNSVTPTPNPNYFEIGDQTRVSRDEVERIYAEQQRRLKGQDDVAPAPRVQTVDRLRTGQIPGVEQVPKGQREFDPTCSPYGGMGARPRVPTLLPTHSAI